MKKKNLGAGTLIIVEAIALCCVLLLSIFTMLPGKSSSTGMNTQSNSEKNSETESETENRYPILNEDAALAYEEVRLKFSQEVEEKLASMTTEEKVAQLFLLTPETLTGVEKVTISGNGTKTALNRYPVGGLIYDADNFQGVEQVKKLTENAQIYIKDRIGLPLFLAVEETGGVDGSPIASIMGFDITKSPAEMGNLADENLLSEEVDLRAKYLSDAGFNMVFGATGNLVTGENAYEDDKSYGADWSIAHALMGVETTVLKQNEVTGVLRYFPRQGDSGEYTEATVQELAVFQAAIDSGVPVIMVGHGKAEYMTLDPDLSCSMSKGVVASVRGAMGYKGILITAPLTDDRITSVYTPGEAAVGAIVAGMDMIYEPADFPKAYDAVVAAVNDGTISQMRLENAVGKILESKMN